MPRGPANASGSHLFHKYLSLFHKYLSTKSASIPLINAPIDPKMTVPMPGSILIGYCNGIQSSPATFNRPGCLNGKAGPAARTFLDTNHAVSALTKTLHLLKIQTSIINCQLKEWFLTFGHYKIIRGYVQNFQSLHRCLINKF